MTVPTKLLEAAADAAVDVAEIGDPVSRYTAAVELAGWYQQAAIDIVTSQSPTAVPDAPDPTA